METQKTESKSFLGNKNVVYVVVGIAILMFIFSTFGGNSTLNTSSTEDNFQNEARVRFNDIATSIPELEAVNCEGDCKHVVYFDFKTLPDDLETIIRGNTATFSKFKMEKTGVSNVTIAGRIDGKTVFFCEASQGKVKECN